MLPALLLAAMTIPVSSTPEPGISSTLAAYRSRSIRDVRYELVFDIPSAPAERIRGRERLRFELREQAAVVLDFDVPAERLLSVSVAGKPVEHAHVNGHIVLAGEHVSAGQNEITIEFLAGDVPLNRSPEFVYSLFVPARASQAFPCFDQPDVKARYSLTLTVPANWQVVANAPEISREVTGARLTARFEETRPLPTYLFSFAAGRFTVEEAERQGRRMRMFHRETDAAKVARNREAIFDLHASALAWLERYTEIPYPFGKFDFVLIPSFQFGGMEHAGAILYNASGLLLDDTATQNQKLGRASLIAHETAHMWFGDLVTMRWFDDVWMKEVFANFMAAKIVNPSFPEINHELRFLLAHYPAAYDIDRTAGTNAIRQPLTNLAEAGSLYGAIIYQKAPTVMRQLEERIGADEMQLGLREYLKGYAFANASWPDLIAILDARTPEDLARWSEAWVSEEGRPTIRTDLVIRDGRVTRLTLRQSDPYTRRGLLWPQRLRVTLGYPDGERTVPVDLTDAEAVVLPAVDGPAPHYVIPAGQGRGYGRFVLDAGTLAYLTARIETLADVVTRGSAWVALWEAMLHEEVAPRAFVETALRALAREGDELLTQRVLAYLSHAYWKFLDAEQRSSVAARVEQTLRDGQARASTKSLKAAWFSATRDVALTPATLSWLERVWRRQEPVPGLTFAETDEIEMAQQLALREVKGWSAILDEQYRRIENPDRKARFAFVMPALSGDPDARDGFVARLTEPANRRREPWVADGLRYVHHPLRAAGAERHLLPALQMLPEIQRTGDIFFPRRWTDAVLSGHASPTAAARVRKFIDGLPASYPIRLRKVLLSGADELFRAARLPGQPAPSPADATRR